MKNGWIACAAVYLLTLVSVVPIGRLGWRIGAVDVPRDARRMHQKPIPRCGGIAILCSFLIGCILFSGLDAAFVRVLLGAILMGGVGLIDDIRSLSPLIKLLAQILAASAACLHVEAGFPFAVLWVAVIANAHNFIDGIDGLFAGCASVESAALAVILFLIGHDALILPVLLIGVACLAFRGYNRHPARIFAGDCGSATVGYLLGVFSLPLFYEMKWEAGWLSPIFLFIYPLTDLITAVARRILRGKSPFCADRGHLHHRICAIGVGQSACGGVLILLCAVFGIVSVSLCTGEHLLAASLACLVAVAFLLEIRALLYSS